MRELKKKSHTQIYHKNSHTTTSTNDSQRLWFNEALIDKKKIPYSATAHTHTRNVNSVFYHKHIKFMSVLFIFQTVFCCWFCAFLFHLLFVFSFKHLSFSFSWLIWFDYIPTATQQGTRTRSFGMDLQCVGRESAIRQLWRYFERWHHLVQIDQQNCSWFGEKDPRARHKLPIDGKCTTLPSRHQEIRCTWGGNFPNRRFVWATKHPTSDVVLVLIRTHCKPFGHYEIWLLFNWAN